MIVIMERDLISQRSNLLTPVKSLNGSNILDVLKLQCFLIKLTKVYKLGVS